jgi:YtkA-like protein
MKPLRLPSPPALLLPALLALAGSCGDDAPPAGPDAAYDCVAEENPDIFVVGLEKTGAAGYHVRLMSSDPAPPARNDNVWEIEVSDSAGATQPGLSVDVTTFMPAHGHVGAPTAVTDDGAGLYNADPVNLWMPGLWEITVKVGGSDGTALDEVKYRFCIGA